MHTRDDFTQGMRVVDTYTGLQGVVATDFYRACARNEVPVQFDGESGPIGTDFRKLKVIPKPPEPAPEPPASWLDPLLLIFTK